jgi:hypothetical protein
MCTHFAAGTVAFCNHHNLNTDSFVLQQVQLHLAITTIWILTVLFHLPYTKEKQLFVLNKKCWIIPLSCLKSCTVGVQQHSVRISSNPCTIYKAKKLYFSDVRCKEKLCRIGRLCGSVLIFRLFKGRGWLKQVGENVSKCNFDKVCNY